MSRWIEVVGLPYEEFIFAIRDKELRGITFFDKKTLEIELKEDNVRITDGKNVVFVRPGYLTDGNTGIKIYYGNDESKILQILKRRYRKIKFLTEEQMGISII